MVDPELARCAGSNNGAPRHAPENLGGALNSCVRETGKSVGSWGARGWRDSMVGGELGFDRLAGLDGRWRAEVREAGGTWRSAAS